MSREIEVSEALRQASISLTAFWGGNERGRCVQVTQPDSEGAGRSQFIQLTVDEARELACALLDFAEPLAQLTDKQRARLQSTMHSVFGGAL